MIPFGGVTKSPDDPEFDWPDLAEIKAIQDKHKDKAPKDAKPNDSKLSLIKGEAWIPDEAVDLKLRLLTIAHAGNSGHRGVDPTWHALRKEFT